MATVRARLSKNRAAAEHSQVSGLWQRREGGADGLVVLQRVLTQQALLVPHCELQLNLTPQFSVYCDSLSPSLPLSHAVPSGETDWNTLGKMLTASIIGEVPS